MLLRYAIAVGLAATLSACSGGTAGPSATDTALPEATAVERCALDESLPTPVHVACEDLLAQTARTPDEVVSVTATEWPDNCLDLPEPNETCAEVITPGFEVVFAIADGRFVYHTDAATEARFADFYISRPGEDAGAEAVALGSGAVAFAFAPDGRLFFNLLGLGEIRWLDPSGAGADRGTTFAQLDIFRGSECGLLGIAIDPEFETNGHVYIYATQPAGANPVGKPRVIRYTDVDGEGKNPTVIVDDLPLTNPETCAHVGGNLHFGPDGYLYLTIGNNERPDEAVAADLSSPLGKVLRMNKEDGSAAPGNPFENDPAADPRVYAYGLRNPWDFAFHPETGKIYAPDNGPGNCDELNIIEPGGDYGVPGSLPSPAEKTCLGLGGRDPIYLFAQPGASAAEFGSNVAPAGVAFLEEGLYPGLGTGLLVCEFNTANLRYLEFSGPEQATVSRDVVLSEYCRYNVEVGPDGLIYFASDDAILRLPPEALDLPR